MKKNLLTIIILAICVANLILNAILIFTILPQAKKANELIEDVCSAISLDLNSGGGTSTTNVPLSETEIYTVNKGEKITTNLAESADGQPHYVVFALTLTLNKNSENYEVYPQTVLTEKDSIIVSDVIKIIGTHTLEEVNGDMESIKAEMLGNMQDLFGKDYVVGINISSLTTQ